MGSSESQEYGILKSGPGAPDGSSQGVISNVAQKKEPRLWSYKNIGQVLTLLFLNCMTLSRLFHLSEPQFPPL